MESTAKSQTFDVRSSVSRMVGIALLWAGLAGAIALPTRDGGGLTTAIAVVAFLCFAAGVALFADGLKRQIVRELRAPSA